MADKDDFSLFDLNKTADQRIETIRKREIIDGKFGFQKLTGSLAVTAWLVNFQPAEIIDESTKSITAVTDFYFIEENGNRFKVSYPYKPYLYIKTTPNNDIAVSVYLLTKYNYIEVQKIEKDDLNLKNHLSGLKNVFLKVSFPSLVEMTIFKKELNPLIKKNKERLDNTNEYAFMLAKHLGANEKEQEIDVSNQIIDMREHDLPYHMRVCIDKKIFAGLWYTVVAKDPQTNMPSIIKNNDIVNPPDLVVCAFDIETTKLPLKFPDSEIDQIMMISYMIDGTGFLIINREIISEDIEDFEYSPRSEFRGEFKVYNELNEKELIKTFFNHILKIKPSIMVTYNGDFFDWPFVENRANQYQISMAEYTGFYKDNQDEYKHNNCIHMDAFKWVVRDSYLPMGSQSLKATTKAKLHYDPVELDPELMVDMARRDPKTLANYSVSDAVATYYLYMKYVHPFIFALCTIIPLGPDDVLRKGSGTLCEALLMVEAFHKNIIFPNKQIIRDHNMTSDGHLLENETYVGGYVETLESGVFRADIPCKFRLDVKELSHLKDKVSITLKHALCSEMNISIDEVLDFDKISKLVQNKLDFLINNSLCNENPKIYHLDVGAMYPNIILTNRLQPPSVVTEEDCLACIFNVSEAKCKRHMNWVWRGELIPATKGEYDRLMQQLEQEKFGNPLKPFHLLSKDERNKIEKKRVQDFCRKAYGKLHLTRIQKKTTTICQRENAFYVDTVLAFRDRRYDYKALLKEAKIAESLVDNKDLSGQKQAQALIVLYESLQLAHKCILNSFYGYAMRKGSRWFSMEMAGIVCHTGSNIITEARQLVEKIGRPLELDTDGIWCLLPSSFPENYDFQLKNGKKITVSYPGAMLNELVKNKFTNKQYHNLKSDGSYEILHKNSIFFEVDGPYLAMILPASKEEGKKLKKRYAVFNFDGSLAELKGFEMKRRGELAIIKHFQTAVFKSFLKGATLSEIYEYVAKEANYWMDILFTKAVDLPNDELFELIGENRSMSKKLEDYGTQKSTSITTAKRLAEFLGDEMVKNAGLACKFIISKYPQDTPVTERTIPLAIFQSEPKICCHFLKKWTKNFNLTVDTIDIRELIDWNYYIERVGSCIQKIVTIPAALQGIQNPVPRVPHPKWLEIKRRERVEMHAQPRITDMFKSSLIQSNLEDHPENSQNNYTNRKRLFPLIGYDEDSNSKFISTHNDESVTLFQGFFVDNNKDSVSNKRRKQNETEEEFFIIDDEVANDGITNFQTNINEIYNNQENDNKNFVLKDINIENTDKNNDMLKIEFWKRPVKGKKFCAKNKNQVSSSILSIIMAKSSSTQVQLKKTWLNDGFNEWLKFLKVKWEYQIILHKKKLNSQENSLILKKNNRSQNILSKRWTFSNETVLHIIQISETKLPGQFTVFALSKDGLRRFNLVVPRVFYIDDIHERANANCRLVMKTLPKMHLASNLYEFIVDESLFASKLNDFNCEMCSMRINGIYESQVPLLFKAIVEIGINCRLDIVKNSFNVSLEQLHMIKNDDLNYTKLKNFRVMFFYEFTYSNRSVFAFFSSSTFQGFIFIINRSQVDVLNMDNLYKIELKKFIETYGSNIIDKNLLQIKIQVIQMTSIKEGSQRLHNILKAMKFSTMEPILFCIQSTKNSLKLAKDFKFINEYPQVRLNIFEPLSLMNVLDWANVMAKRSIQHFFNSFIYLKDYWIMSQYSHIPIGNISNDFSIFALDILYARQLKLKNYLLWASSSSKPDFGGKELHDWRFGNEWETVSFCQKTGYIFNKETFDTKNIVVELGLGAVAVTALLQSTHIAEAEGTSEFVSFTAADTSSMSIQNLLLNRLVLTNYNESISVSGALRILKEVFHELVRDIHLYENIFADQLVINMHRWIRDPNALMYNPAICSAVSTLMRKLCLLLVTEINRLGGNVIYCSFTKIVLSTNRDNFQTASGFIELLINSLSKKSLFASIHISVLQYSSLFLWIDPTNYALVKCNEKLNDKEEFKNETQVRLHFSMSKCLPEEHGCAKVFKNIIAGYLVRLSEKLKEKISDNKFEIFCNNVFEEEITPTLFKLITKFVELRHQLKISEKNNPVYFADSKDFDIPLEFVKCVCKILSTNSCISQKVDSVRSQLMLILQMDDASPLTFWSPPPVSIVLEYVYCKKCNQSADLNISTGSIEDTDGSIVFVCLLCRTKLTSELIEEMLTERTSKILQSFILQDYKCLKCNKIAMCYLAKYCECSNTFGNTISTKDLKLNLKLIHKVSKRHNFRNLIYIIDKIYSFYE